MSAPIPAQRQTQAARPPSTAPNFTDEDALAVFDDVQAALESYNRKRFLAEFDSAQMPNFALFQEQIKTLFSRYDSFTVTYRLSQAAMEGGRGVALADFGLDGTSTSEDLPDLRRHAQLRIEVAWDGKAWKITDLSPRAIFE